MPSTRGRPIDDKPSQRTIVCPSIFSLSPSSHLPRSHRISLLPPHVLGLFGNVALVLFSLIHLELTCVDQPSSLQVPQLPHRNIGIGLQNDISCTTNQTSHYPKILRISASNGTRRRARPTFNPPPPSMNPGKTRATWEQGFEDGGLEGRDWFWH